MTKTEESALVAAFALMTLLWVVLGIFALAAITPFVRIFILYTFAGFIPWVILAWATFLKAGLEVLEEGLE